MLDCQSRTNASKLPICVCAFHGCSPSAAKDDHFGTGTKDEKGKGFWGGIRSKLPEDEININSTLTLLELDPHGITPRNPVVPHASSLYSRRLLPSKPYKHASANRTMGRGKIVVLRAVRFCILFAINVVSILHVRTARMTARRTHHHDRFFLTLSVYVDGEIAWFKGRQLRHHCFRRSRFYISPLVALAQSHMIQYEV